ncbi:AIF_HP2_G0044660.mRNA.1.CDS.1 [Saccharomyces cerevisiae]|nr:AIF_HP2_G0044660.mRNA.1.CDS.1 [Saccharomyces cerevisiae]CAI6727742.1 AIF_HP2_G0044660.mRNA.1.CDS.1 [Saccharomyces cerevisiae]
MKGHLFVLFVVRRLHVNMIERDTKICIQVRKRYVCGGKLKDGKPWGCGKKFARSDALGRHFKTESGRRCITPLYEEARQEKSGQES